MAALKMTSGNFYLKDWLGRISFLHAVVKIFDTGSRAKF